MRLGPRLNRQSFPMLIIPAIDLKDGKCVRLKQGAMEQATVFSDDPVGTAKQWLEQGARRVLLVPGSGAEVDLTPAPRGGAGR